MPGRIHLTLRLRSWRHAGLVALLLGHAVGAGAAQPAVPLPGAGPTARPGVEVVALFRDRAVLRTAAGERMLRVGETSIDGVTLLAADAKSARVRYQGREQVLALSTRVASSFMAAAPARIALSPDAQGHYRVGGSINGRPADFLVDTGASIVVMNSQHARALGVDFERGQRGSVQTAQGNVDAWFVSLDTVAVAGIESRGVQAAIVEGGFPVDVLLGMSFLREVTIEARDGVMTLIRKH
jgi:aspartyl protease family protein